jgi:hypothetical protein
MPGVDPNPLDLMGWTVFEDKKSSPRPAFFVECPSGFLQMTFLQNLSIPFLSGNPLQREWISGNHEALELGSFIERQRKENGLSM